jgi:hypothetical protein
MTILEQLENEAFMESEPRKIVTFYSGNWAQNAQENNLEPL